MATNIPQAGAFGGPYSNSNAAIGDSFQTFLKRTGAAGLDPNGRPIGSTGGMIALNADDERELASYGRGPVASSNGTTAGAGTTNVFANLNRILGTNFGEVAQPLAVRAAVDDLPANQQIAGGLKRTRNQAQAALIAQRIADAGGLPDPSMPAWQQAQQQKVAEAIYNRSQVKPGDNRFLPPGNAYIGSDPTLRSRAIAANGAEVAGAGDVMVSASPNAAGGTNFSLRQGSTIPKSVFMPPSVPAKSVAEGTPIATPQPNGAGINLMAGIERARAAAAAANGATVAKPDTQPTPLETDTAAYQAAVDGATNPSRYHRTGPMTSKDGAYIGDGVFDTKTGRTGLMGDDGQFKPLPPGTEPITATGLQKSIPDMKQFRALKGELTDAEISLRNMDRYIESVGDARTGIARLADKFSAGMKTLSGQGLNTKELAAKIGQGQLQGLLGANRTNVVGGGVMTEADALRVIERLGGDFDALSNPEVVRKAISQVYSDRFAQYEDSHNFYNAAVSDFYGARGFKLADKVPFSDKLAGLKDQSATAAAPLKVTAIRRVK